MLCERLAEYVTSMRFEDIPREVIEKTKAVAAHEIAVSLGGVGNRQTNCALDLIERKEGPATVLGQAFKAAPIDAAFANTVAGRALRSEGTMLPSLVHAGCCQVPTALAFAEQYGRSGADVLTALVVGFEVIGKVAGSAQDWDKPYRTSSHMFGALGVAAVAARMMELDVEQTAGALAQACNLGAMISTGMQDVQYGIVTRNGIFAAQLGKCRAPFAADALEEPVVGFYTVQLHGSRPTDKEIVGSFGERFEIMSTILKPHPCTGQNLVPIQLVRQEMRRRGLTGDRIRRITVTRGRQVKQLDNVDNYGPFDGVEGGIYQVTSSLPFALGVMLVDGEITREHFLKPNDPRIAIAMRKVRIDYTLDVPYSAYRDRVEIETDDGETVTMEGGPDILPVPDVAQFLNTYGVPLVGETKIRDLQDALAKFETLPDIKTLTRCLA